MTKRKNNLNAINGVTLLNLCRNCGDEFHPTSSMTNEPLCNSCLEKGKSSQDEYWAMKYTSKIKLTENDFGLVGMNYNYFMIPRLAYPKENLEKLKQQILDNQEMAEELKAVWDKGESDTVTDEILQIMKKYFGKMHSL